MRAVQEISQEIGVKLLFFTSLLIWQHTHTHIVNKISYSRLLLRLDPFFQQNPEWSLWTLHVFVSVEAFVINGQLKNISR